MFHINIMNIKEFLLNKKVSELKLICKDNGIIGISKINKAALVEIMSECELKNTGYNPIVNMSDIVPPTIIEEQAEQTECICDSLGCGVAEQGEEIILHLPPKVANHSEKWKEMFAKGKKILNK
tara:strand:+ start:248 stop:619 length:372 start_codon:yes stop_codon:yes gene_type:complete